MRQQASQPPKRGRKRKKWPWLLLVAALAVGAVIYVAASRSGELYTEEAAQIRDIVTYYSFSGSLTPVSDETQTAKSSLKIKELYVSEGENVSEGTLLLRGTNGERVYAAYTGTLETLYAEEDDALQPGSQIARIVDYQTLEVSIDVDEYDINAVEEGKEGIVYINALDRSVTGIVSDIARDATIEGGVSYYKVKMQVDAGRDVRSGMSVEVNLLNRQALGVNSISLKALQYDEYNKPYVLVMSEENKRIICYVDIGVSDGQHAEITAGLANGQSVYYLGSSMARFYAMQSEMMNSRQAAMGSD